MRAGLILLGVICAFIAFGCSKSSDPIVAPVDNPGVSRPVDAPRYVASSGRVLWGFWRISISADRSTVEVIADRSADLHVNTVRLLEDFPCKDCLVVSGVKFNPPHELSADLKLIHPYPGALKFTAFDVRGIFISGTGFTFPACGREIAWGDTLPRMLNPDGYTPLFNPTEYPETFPAALGYIPGHMATGGDLSANLNPFVAYSVGMPRRIFEAGSQQTRTVNLWIPDGPLEFGYAVDASWQLVEEVTDPLTDFPPDANCIEPYEITVQVGDGSGVPICGDTQITAGIYDHQGLDTIGAVTIEAPDLFDGVIPLDYVCDIGSEGWLFAATINNEHGAPDGVYPLVLKVDDLWVDPNLGEVDGWQVVDVNAIGQSTSDVGWARTWGGVETDYAQAVAAGNAGNVLVAGYYMNEVDFDPGPGVVKHASTINYSAPDPFYTADVFLSSFSAAGDFEWVVVLGSDSEEWPFDVTVDSTGSIYVTGLFQGSVDFDPGPGTDVHSSTGGFMMDPFLLKLDSSGNFVWARTWGGLSADLAYGVETDDAGNVYVTGVFQLSADFDPGPGQYVISSNGAIDVYVTTFDSSGSFRWARGWGGPSVEFGKSVAVTGTGAVYVGGYFMGSVDFDPGPGYDTHTSEGSNDAFVSRFGPLGSYQGVRTWGGAYTDDCDAIAVDSSDNLYVVGAYQRVVDFDPGPGITYRLANGAGDAYLSKFDPDGNFVWVQDWGEIVTDYSLDVAVDASGLVNVTGYFGSTVDFDPGPGVDLHASKGLRDVFLTRFDSAGAFQWAATWGGTEEDSGLGVSVDSLGNVYVCGNYRDRVDFHPGDGYTYYCSNGLDDAFLSKLPPDGNW